MPNAVSEKDSLIVEYKCEDENGDEVLRKFVYNEEKEQVERFSQWGDSKEWLKDSVITIWNCPAPHAHMKTAEGIAVAKFAERKRKELDGQIT